MCDWKPWSWVDSHLPLAASRASCCAHTRFQDSATFLTLPLFSCFAMAKDKRKSKEAFLAGYDTRDDYLVSPDPLHGTPGLVRGRDPEGREVLVKLWPRIRQSNEEELRQMWRSEIRHIQRLAAVPRAEDLFVPMLASGEDEDGFYLVLDPGQGSPLEIFRRGKNPPEALSQPRPARNRRRLWANILRAAQGLELLHSQGFIHRNIDPWAIVTAFDDRPDFRITGFEWSMRVAAADTAAPARNLVEGKDAVASFGRDWSNLALLAAQLLDAPLDRVADLGLVPSEIAEHISAVEGQLLRSMLRIETAERLDGELICHRMEEIVSAIAAEAAGREARLALALDLGGRSQLSQAIRRASDNEIEMTDLAAQISFVDADLSDEPYLARLKGRDGEHAGFALFGHSLAYRLSPYRQPGSSEQSNWEFASCEHADAGRPSPGRVGGSTPLPPSSLELFRRVDADRNFPRKRGRVERWDGYISETEPKESRKSDLDRMHESFSLLLILEMAYAVADVFPVEVLPGVSDRDGDLHTLRLASRHDLARAQLSTALGIEAPALRLTKMLESDDLQEDGSWTLTEAGVLGDRTHETEWRFVKRSEETGQEVLHFEGSAKADIQSIGFLTPPGMGGQVAQFKRRSKALKALREHRELLRMLSDPRIGIGDSHDPLDEKDERFSQLDKSKQDALREILSTVPLFLLQGPPGVGKTYLVGDIVRRRFGDDSTTRMLLSAQSNAAIDHLMKEVQSVFSEDAEAPPVMVRARPADDDASDTDLEVDKQADLLLQALANSELVEEASPNLAAKVVALAEARREASQGKGRARARRMSAEGRAFEGMILRAANLVFATTNSSAVERLMDEGSLFDWTIIEEAGKATGGELLSPLLLSHRRLMIGDHKQLPPYGADKMGRLLAIPDKVKSAVTVSQALVSRYLRDPGIEELFKEVEDEVESGVDAFGRLCSDTLSILTLFETLVEGELTPRTTTKPRRPIARRLDEQHRMHPVIADIVSKCFYEGQLSTNPTKAKEYSEGIPPLGSVNTSRLPDTPVVFVDMPYVRGTRGYRGSEVEPPWSNPDEVNAAVDVLKLMRAKSGTYPSVAILSPYREQVRALKHRVGSGLSGHLAHLREFQPAVGNEEYCGTVDSFQGDQADMVIVSMVRNNGHATPGKALGFLRDDRRMNVLLSRAKWRLIIVGSLEFYQNVVGLSAAIPDAELGFMKTFLSVLKEAEAAKSASIVPWSSLRGET